MSRCFGACGVDGKAVSVYLETETHSALLTLPGSVPFALSPSFGGPVCFQLSFTAAYGRKEMAPGFE